MRAVRIVATLVGSVTSLLLLLFVVFGYTSGFELVIRNPSSSRLELFLTSSERVPAFLPALHQEMRRYPQLTIGPKGSASIWFDSDSRRPVGAYVRREKEVRFWSYESHDTQWGGSVDIPVFETLALAAPPVVAELDHNWRWLGFLRIALIVTVPSLTLIGWLLIIKCRTRRHSQRP